MTPFLADYIGYEATTDLDLFRLAQTVGSEIGTSETNDLCVEALERTLLDKSACTLAWYVSKSASWLIVWTAEGPARFRLAVGEVSLREYLGRANKPALELLDVDPGDARYRGIEIQPIYDVLMGSFSKDQKIETLESAAGPIFELLERLVPDDAMKIVKEHGRAYLKANHLLSSIPLHAYMYSKGQERVSYFLDAYPAKGPVLTRVAGPDYLAANPAVYEFDDWFANRGLCNEWDAEETIDQRLVKVSASRISILCTHGHEGTESDPARLCFKNGSRMTPSDILDHSLDGATVCAIACDSWNGADLSPVGAFVKAGAAGVFGCNLVVDAQVAVEYSGYLYWSFTRGVPNIKTYGRALRLVQRGTMRHFGVDTDLLRLLTIAPFVLFDAS